ncbi:MAG: 2-octaprenyl-6-methoxyphenyl hydroxylase, partial [Pseudomonadota bacterium]
MAPQASENVDIAIVGGGLVGSSLACALERGGLTVALIEAADTPDVPPGFDQRKLALAQRSMDVLDRLGVLPLLSALPTPIRRIHISRTGDFGRTLLEASEFGHAAFGAVVLAQDLGVALAKRVQTLQQTRRICPARVSACRFDADGAHLTLAVPGGAQAISARLVVAADGTDSFIRHAAGIGIRSHDYGQTLFVCSLRADQANDGTAYERFSEQGPVALLPMADGAYGAICGVASA